jgi:hypothetical protein
VTGALVDGASTASIGSSNQKELPFPGALSSSSLPPISSTRRREIARPRPVPPCFLVSEPSI